MLGHISDAQNLQKDYDDHQHSDVWSCKYPAVSASAAAGYDFLPWLVDSNPTALWPQEDPTD